MNNWKKKLKEEVVEIHVSDKKILYPQNIKTLLLNNEVDYLKKKKKSKQEHF